MDFSFGKSGITAAYNWGQFLVMLTSIKVTAIW